MSSQIETGHLQQHMDEAEAIVASLPEPDHTVNYQVRYPVPGRLVDAVAELLATQGVTTPRLADAFTQGMTEVGDPDSPTMVAITGSCKEGINVATPISTLAEASEVDLAIVSSSRLGPVVKVQRNRGQYKKPRSKPVEVLPNGDVVPVYVGDLVHSEDPYDRTPDPTRLVAGGLQAHDLETELTRRMGYHVPAAHEALSLPYEKAFIRKDPDTGDLYSLSADLPWAGLRTNQLDSEIIKLLMGIENTVGVKIGGNSDEAHIAGLAERLNPKDRAGKLVYMLRLGLHEADKYPTILGAINKHAPNAITIFDIHGTTEERSYGAKIRHVPSIIQGMGIMAQACQEAGVKFAGVHLETTSDGHRFECTDETGQPPLDEGDVDPRLNLLQMRRVLDAVGVIQEAQAA
jgi:3-deoxy-7-phosphoheptulonate synthase